MTMHSFPNPKDGRFSIWIEFCQVPIKSTRKRRICSVHFEDYYFVKNLNGERFTYLKQPKLMSNAVPTLHPPGVPNTNFVDIKNGSQPKSTDTNNTISDPLNTGAQESESFADFIDAFAEEIDNDHQSTIDALKARLSAAQFHIQRLDRAKGIAQSGKQNLADQIFKMSRQVQEMQQQQQQHVNTHSDDMTIAQKYLTPNQIDVLVNQQNAKPKWTSDEIAIAYALRRFSVSCYTMLCSRLNYPLPDETTIARWTNEMCMRHGTLIDVVKAMDSVAVAMKDVERLTVLLVDSMRLEDMQVSAVMARSLVGNWRQIVNIDFNCLPTPQRLNDIIVELHTSNFNVVAMVCDVPITHRQNVSIKQPYIKHPCSNEKIFIFPNSTQLIVQLSRESLNSTFVVEGRNPADILQQPLARLLEVCSTNETTIYEQLIEQIFNADIKPIVRGDKLAGKKYIEWIQYIGKYYEIMNSTCQSNDNNLYGLQLNKQREMLTEFSKNISEMRCVDQRATFGFCVELQPFQLGIMIGIKSLQQLYDEFSSKYAEIDCIYGAKLNMDSLTKFLGDVKQMPDVHYHPSPKIRVLERIKRIAYGPPSPNVDPLREPFLLENSIVSEALPMLHGNVVNNDCNQI